MLLTKYFSLALLVLVLSANLFAQKEIAQEEYSSKYYGALEKARDSNRRHTSKREIYREGKPYESEEWQYEYVLPYRRQFTYSKKSDTENILLKEVNIDENNYCNLDGNTWQKVPSTCIKGFAASTSQGSVTQLNKVAPKYSFDSVVLDGTKTSVYREYHESKLKTSVSQVKEVVYYRESLYWLNEKGQIIRQVTTSGILGTEKIYSKWIDTFEYNPKDLKIEAPIK